MEFNIPRVVISSIKGKSGKTTITMGFLYKLVKSGYKVQPFKVGPDFIDPSYHKVVTNRDSRNLDAIMFDEAKLLNSFYKACIGADIAVIEGVFGLYDSPDGLTEVGSTAHLSKMLRAPVILVVDSERINRGIQAIIQGFLSFDKDVMIKGIILNNVSKEAHAKKLISGIKSRFPDVEVVGVVFKSELISRRMDYRHLGLVHISERDDVTELISLADYVGNCLDVGKIIEIAKDVRPLDIPLHEYEYPTLDINVGVTFDKAFSFYYPDNVEFLSKHAKRICLINSLVDRKLPDIDLLIVGGGFPEVYADKLEQNESLRKDIYDKWSKGLAIYGECGGLMYLTNKLITFDNEEYEMVGLIDGTVKMVKKPVGHGYVRLKAIEENPLSSIGVEIVGHEFHYSVLKLNETVKYAFKVIRGFGLDGKHDGILKDNLLAQYTHLHVNHNQELFYNLLKYARRKS